MAPETGVGSGSVMDEVAVNPALGYERFMVPPLFAPAAERLIAVAAPHPGARVLDIGTGTGIVARRIASRLGAGGAITGLDLSRDMLEVARDMADQEGLALAWREGKAEALPFENATFDLVVSQFALMFFADRAAALREMWRVLVPGGRVALSVFQDIGHHPFYVALDEAIARHLGTSPVGDIFALGDAGAVRSSLADAGFRDVAVAPFTLVARFPNPDMFLAGEIDVDTAAIPAMQGLDPTARATLTAAIQEEMAEPLRAVTDGDQVLLPFHAQIAHARR